MNIVDMRLRPPTKSWISKPQYREGTPDHPTRIGFPRAPSAEKRSMELLLREMDQAGIKWGVAMGRQSAEPFGRIPNDEIAEFLKKYPDRFVSFVGVDISQSQETCIGEIKRFIKSPGFVGVSIETCASDTPMHCDDKRLYPIYDICQSMNVPISVSLSALLAAMAGASIELASPLSLYRVAKDFPNLDIVISHGAWPWVQEVLGLAFCCPRVWVSPDLYLVGVNTPGAHEYVKAANMYLSDRVLFGTAYPSRPLVESVQAFNDWTFKPGVKEKILGENALRVMRMA